MHANYERIASLQLQQRHARTAALNGMRVAPHARRSTTPMLTRVMLANTRTHTHTHHTQQMCAFIRGELIKLACVKCNFLCKFPVFCCASFDWFNTAPTTACLGKYMKKRDFCWCFTTNLCVLMALKWKWKINIFTFQVHFYRCAIRDGIHLSTHWSELRLICNRFHG